MSEATQTVQPMQTSSLAASSSSLSSSSSTQQQQQKQQTDTIMSPRSDSDTGDSSAVVTFDVSAISGSNSRSTYRSIQLDSGSDTASSVVSGSEMGRAWVATTASSETGTTATDTDKLQAPTTRRARRPRRQQNRPRSESPDASPPRRVRFPPAKRSILKNKVQNGPAKRRGIAWNEDNLQQNEDEKVPRMKIDEPPTPYNRQFNGSDADSGMSDADELVSPRSPLTAKRNVVTVDTKQISSEAVRRRTEFDETEAETDSRKHTSFLEKRKAHYRVPAAFLRKPQADVTPHSVPSDGSESGSESDIE
jgi:Protein phosphatase inhibitor 2 (IPP-2)